MCGVVNRFYELKIAFGNASNYRSGASYPVLTCSGIGVQSLCVEKGWAVVPRTPPYRMDTISL